MRITGCTAPEISQTIRPCLLHKPCFGWPASPSTQSGLEESWCLCLLVSPRQRGCDHKTASSPQRNCNRASETMRTHLPTSEKLSSIGKILTRSLGRKGEESRENQHPNDQMSVPRVVHSVNHLHDLSFQVPSIVRMVVPAIIPCCLCKMLSDFSPTFPRSPSLLPVHLSFLPAQAFPRPTPPNAAQSL